VRALVDRHHSDLFYAIQLLFEDRLGIEVYTPIGHDWWDAGYWRFGEGWGDDRLAQQFLNPAGWDQRKCHCSGRYTTWDQHHPSRPVEGVTLAKAQQWDWDFVVATVQDNQRGFHQFATEKGAKYAVWVGNVRQQIDESLGPIVLDLPQEFDHNTTFRFREPVTTEVVTSFVNLLPRIPEAWAGFDGLRSRLPGWEFRSYGHDCPDGFADPASAVADAMAAAGWAYHDKVTGDGFGHVIHNWAAVGRPLIGHGHYYAGQRGSVFWQDGVTCLDLDKHSLDEAADILRRTGPDQVARMGRAIRALLDATYDPATIAEQARQLLFAKSTTA